MRKWINSWEGKDNIKRHDRCICLKHAIRLAMVEHKHLSVRQSTEI